MAFPFYDRKNRSLPMREQVIARLRQLNPDNRDYFNEKYLARLKDWELVQALECSTVWLMDKKHQELNDHLFEAGRDYERERIVKSLNFNAPHLTSYGADALNPS